MFSLVLCCSRVRVVVWVKLLLEFMVIRLCLGLIMLLLLVMISEVFLLVIVSMVLRWFREWLVC